MGLRKVQTRCSNRQHFYHETEGNGQSTLLPTDIIRPPTSHPYSAYKYKNSQSPFHTTKYSSNFFLQIKPQIKLSTNVKQQKNNCQSYLYLNKLPQTFKLVVNQIRIVIKNCIKNKINQFQQLIDNLAKLIIQLIQNNNYLQTQKISNDKQIGNLNTRINLLQKKTTKKEICQELKKVHKKYENISKKQQEVLIENCKLGELNAKYLARINQLENNKRQKMIDLPNFKENQTKTDTELLRCNNRITYLEMKLNTAQKVQHELLLTNQKLQIQLTQSTTKIQQISTQHHTTIQKMNEWREKAMMQKQDQQIHISRQQFLLYSLKKLKQNNRNLLSKLLQTNNNDEIVDKKQMEPNPNFDYQMDFFKNIRTMYQKGKGEKMYAHEEIKKNQLGIDVQEVSLEIDYQNYKKSDSFDVSTLQYYRPSFYSFIEQSSKVELAQARLKPSNSVSRIFIQILRSILSSKLNQFILNEHPEKYTRFPQFVFAWFEKFYFNTQKNCICMLEPFVQKPITQQQFYKDLMNVKLDQSWEIITFREFILEELSLEELYFYLMCQMLLYSKAGITKQILSHGQFCVLVQYLSAKSVLDIALNDFESWNITFLSTKLREKIITKNNKEYIESGFFLRCLLEYYRIERSNRYRYISKLCNQFHDKNGLSFSSFMSVINRLSEVSLQTKLQLYRNCFCLTKGIITPESIFIVCSQQLIFLKNLKMKSFYRLPKIIQKPLPIKLNSQLKNPPNIGKQLICLQPADPYLYDIIIGFTQIINSPNGIWKRIESLGVSQFHHQILSLIKALDERNSQIGSNVLKCKHFLHYFSNAIQIVRKVTYYNFYELLEEQTKQKSENFWVYISNQDLGSIFAQELKATFQTYTLINNLRIWKDKVYNFRLNNAAKKIQREVKKKFIQPYLEIYSYFTNQAKLKKEDQIKEGKK